MILRLKELKQAVAFNTKPNL